MSFEDYASELTVSTVNDVMKTVNNDKAKANQILKGFVEEERRDKEKKVNELKEQFSIIPKEVIRSILEENKYDVELSIVPLFNKMDEIQKEAKKKEQAEQRKKRDMEDKRRRQEEMKNLMEIFGTIPKETIQRILDENEGDIQDTTNQLLGIVSDQEEAKKQELLKKQQEREEQAKKMRQEQEERMNSLKVDALKEKFTDLPADDILTTLKSTNWDIKEACKRLMAISADKKKNELKNLFQSFDEDQLQEVLEAHDWNMVSTVKALASLREERKQEERKQEERKHQKENPVVITKVQQSLLEKSIIIGKEIEQEIEKEQQRKTRDEEEAKEQFRIELGHIITVQAQNNTMPGVVPPPLPKQIDALLNKKKPVEDSDPEPTPSEPVKESPVTGQAVSGQKSGLVATLTATPSSVDTGNMITVNWDVSSGTTSTSDWIGLFAVDQPNKQYVTYEWNKQDKKGSLQFKAPAVYGAYEFRYFPASSYEHAARSNRVVVGPQIDISATVDKENKKVKVSWSQKSGNQYRRAWVGLYEKTQTNNKLFVAWEYAGNPNTEIVFDCPVKPTAYEIRFFPYSYIETARSNTFTVEGADTLAASHANNTVTIKLNLVSVDPATENVWVGLFLTSQTDNKQWRRYKYVYDRTADVIFKSPQTGGEYEARLFANKSYDCIIKSSPFTIPGKH